MYTTQKAIAIRTVHKLLENPRYTSHFLLGWAAKSFSLKTYQLALTVATSAIISAALGVNT